MSDRPAIPVEIQRELLFECRYRCACCCEPVSLEKAHIDPWYDFSHDCKGDGAGNLPNPYGIKTDYAWRRTLTPGGLTDILGNYTQIVEEKNEKTGKKKRVQIFPRYHQLDVVRKLLADAAWHGTGKRYLIQHSAGSGKSNSIAWLAHQ
jgi:type I restriction enzyme, R subunit